MPEPINLKIVAAISMLKLAQNGGVTDTDEGRKIEEQLQFRLDQESDKENIFVPSENEVHEEWIRGQRAARAKLKGNRPKKEFSEDEKRAYQNISTLMSRRCKNEEKRVKEVLFNLIEVGTADNEQGSELAGLLRLDYQAAASTTNAAVLKKRRDDKKKTAVAARKEATMFKASSDITNTENMRKLEELEAIADELEGKTDAALLKKRRDDKKKTAVAARKEATMFKASSDITNPENKRKYDELEAIADELEGKTDAGWKKNKKKTAVAAKEEATNFKSSNDMTNTENMRKLEELEAIADELESKTYTGWYKNKKKTAVAAREEVFDSIERATNIDELKGDEAFLQLKSDAVQSYTRLRGTADQVGPAHTKFGLYIESAVIAKSIKVETDKSVPGARSAKELFNNCIAKSQSYSDFWEALAQKSK